MATVISVVIGVPLAWVLARGNFPGRRLVQSPRDLAVGSATCGGRRYVAAGVRPPSFVGRYLDEWFGLTIPFTPLAVVLAETFVAMPFLIVTVEARAAFRGPGFRTGGSHPRRVPDDRVRRVTVPLIAPSLIAGAVLCWARALGEFGATITFAGSFPGRTQTMPIAVYYALERDPDAAIALSLVLLLVSVLVLVSLRDQWLRSGATP